MTWNDNERSLFANYLMNLSLVSKDAMYQAVYEVLIRDHDRILKNDVPREEVKRALADLIKWFEEKERYEQCQKLNDIKKCLE